MTEHMEPRKPSLADLRIERQERPKPSSRSWLGLLMLFGLLLLAATAWYLVRHRPVPVTTVPARQSSGSAGESVVLNASGYVTARRQATVSAKITGKVVEVLVEEGMAVKEGQILARLDDTNVRASLRLAEAQLQSAKAALQETQVRLKEAEQELRRQTGLVQSKIATQADYDHAEAAALAFRAKLEQQQTDVTVAERTVATWQQQLEDTIIRAPFSGIVTSKDAQPGEMISPISAGGGFTRTGICTIVDMDSLEIEVDVNESYINRVQPAQPVEAALDAYPDWRIPGKVIAIIPTADRQKSTVKVRVGFNQLDARILPEMSIKVAFRKSGDPSATASGAVIIPAAAVQQRDGRDVVIVAQNGRAEHRAVTISSKQGQEVSVSAGLSAGERVIADPSAGLADGARVKERRALKR